jgi:hypothetical protein
MNLKMLLLLMFAVATSGMSAQVSMPQLNEVSFQQVAESYNTYNKDRELMVFVSGFTLEGDAKLLEKNRIEVLFNPVAGTDRKDCKLLRWDPVLRVWVKFEGNQLQTVKEATAPFWSAFVNGPGVYALMKEVDIKGQTLLMVPDGYRVDNWKYAHANAGIVCEGFTPAQQITIPLPSISPLAVVSMQLRKTGEPLMNLTGMTVGKVVKGLWKDATCTDATFDLVLASK